ncbi:hypothetical protein KAR91_54295, partial [Candidatus Pacearchaeota archaeon]|nr:hypothetical protein [Candidatus Pacearchaeota archaeon]
AQLDRGSVIFQALEEEPLGLILGKEPDSKEEYWVALALWKFDIYFDYQWEIFGGTSRVGGLIVDFVVWNPMMTPLPVHGDYWHRGELKGEDKRDLIAIADYFHIGVENIPVLWGQDAETKEDVEQWVRINVAK